jgi:hypothetical protein
VPLAGGSSALVAEIRPVDHLSAWTRAREMLDQTERWPVVSWTGSWEDVTSGEPFDRQRFVFSDRGSEVVGDTTFAWLLARAEALDYEALLEGEAAQEWKKKYLDSDVEDAMKDVMEKWGTAPGESDVRRAATESADPVVGLERFLLEWELAQGAPPPNAVRIMSYALERDLMPPPMEPAFLALLPTMQPWEVYAYVEGLWNRPSDRLIKAARSWNERFGAECVAFYPGYSTQLRVARPPADISTAFELAREHWLLAADTLMLPGTRLRDYARALVQNRYWELKSKP